ncbi:MAG: 4-hydroxy-tetrahydrodipicolinate synthase [Holosporaceae bacterium]|jgi:4-hydroxy-tetrahydrodipicolinate synthase|nr:4-hydroxy-tetrahydrodipicolinate synthase [Holosporaceae bacterium]
MLNGYIVALVTPFKNGGIDLAAFEKYVDFIADSGVSGMVVCGSTGESLSLSFQEKVELTKAAASFNKGRIKIIGGIVDAATENCVELMKQTEKYVDNFLCVCPFYIKPSQRQIYDHFKKLNDSTSRGIILYNNPSRAGADIGFDVFKRLCELKNIVAIKECSPNLSRFTLWRSAIKKDFDFLCGNDDVVCAALAMGASGVISGGTANLFPNLCVKMYNAFEEKDFETFAALRDALAPAHELMFAEPSPGAMKYALSKMKLISNEPRAPLSPISAELQTKIDELIENLRQFL